MAETLHWTPLSAWAGIARPGTFGAAGRTGVVATLLGGHGLASLIAPPDGSEALARHVEQTMALTLPATPRIVSGPAGDAIWTGPGQWLLRTPSREQMASLIALLSPEAAVSDQSDARAAMRLSGWQVRDALAKGVMIDLHPAAFPVGAAAATSVAHLGVNLWRLPEAADGPVFEIMVARSFAGSFWSWFAASAAEFGCRVDDGRG